MIKKIVKKVFYALKRKNIVSIPNVVYSDKLLIGKNALITGGNGGIGFAIAEELIKNGCKVVLSGTNEASLASCKKKLGSMSEYIVIDIRNAQELKKKIEVASHKIGGGGFNILVNSSGIANQMDFFNTTEDEYDRIMDVNSKGTFFMCQAMARHMIEKGIKGHILNITSSSALRPAWTPYQMSKWAIRGFTLGLADMLAPYGITVNAIAPGQTATKMLGISEGDSLANDSPCGRYIVPSEIGTLAVFLVSDLGNMIIGDTVYMTGGSGVVNSHK